MLLCARGCFRSRDIGRWFEPRSRATVQLWESVRCSQPDQNRDHFTMNKIQQWIVCMVVLKNNWTRKLETGKKQERKWKRLLFQEDTKVVWFYPKHLELSDQIFWLAAHYSQKKISEWYFNGKMQKRNASSKLHIQIISIFNASFWKVGKPLFGNRRNAKNSRKSPFLPEN